MSNDQHTRPKHPKLDDKELERQRGEEPPNPVGQTPKSPDFPDPDPKFVPDPGRAKEWRGWVAEIGKEHRPRREDVLPYLLVRAFSPGDHGQRPLWPPIVCWESPDILLIDATYTGPFDPNRLVLSPVAGRTYRVFVRVWNLGLFPAVGVHVQAWVIAAGFFGTGNQNDPYYQQHHIGGAWIPELTDRQRPGCVRVVELGPPWKLGPGDTGHECMIVSVSCPADHFDGPLLVNEHRHVGQRNLDILAPAESALKLITTLAGLVPKGFTLELTHGGPAAVPLLQALGGGKRRARVVAPALKEIRGGVDIGTSVHLLTAFVENGRTVVVRSTALQKYVKRAQIGGRIGGRSTYDDKGAYVHPFAEPGGTRRLLEQLGPDLWPELGEVSEKPLVKTLAASISRMLEIKGLRARDLAGALGGPVGAQHLLRFTLTSPEGALIGGYSIVVGAAAKVG